MTKLTDLTEILTQWPFDPANPARIVAGNDGRERVFVRRLRGLDQYEVDGHPNGHELKDLEQLLDDHRIQIHAAAGKSAVMIAGLSPEEIAELFGHVDVYYERLVHLCRLQEWIRAERDAAQIHRLLDFVEPHLHRTEDRASFDPWRPRVTRIYAVVRALLHWDACPDRPEPPPIMTVIDFTLQHPAVAGPGSPPGKPEEVPRPTFPTHPLARIAHEENLFRKQDDFWTVRYNGSSAFLKNTRGLQCLASLLGAPDRPIHACELLGCCEQATNAKALSYDDSRELTTGEGDDGITVLDSQAKAEYRCRLNELQQEIEEAEEFNDPERATKAMAEKEALLQSLASAIGLGGRDRKISSSSERARSAVTKRIKQSIQKIRESHPSLGHHLSAHIKPGYFCSYAPDPEQPLNWKF